jgi:hypothetical protein
VKINHRERLWHRRRRRGHNPVWGCGLMGILSQGWRQRHSAPTLGFETFPRWGIDISAANSALVPPMRKSRNDAKTL